MQRGVSGNSLHPRGRPGLLRRWLPGSLVVPAVAIGIALLAAGCEGSRDGGRDGQRNEATARDAKPGEPPPAGPAAEGKTVPLVLNLPRPCFIGTPFNISTANLGPPRSGRPPDLPVPAGVVNVALGKPVTAGDRSPLLGQLSQVTDGDKEGMEGSYVEIGPGKQYFQVDLQRLHEIFAIVVWHYHAQPRAYHDVVVQVGGEGDFIDAVRTVYNNDHDNSLGLGIGQDKEYLDTHEGLLIDARGARARYVRLYGNGNTESDLNHCTEIEVYGRRPVE